MLERSRKEKRKQTLREKKTEKMVQKRKEN